MNEDDDNVVKLTKRRKSELRKEAKPDAKPLHGEGNPKQRGPRGKYKSKRDSPVTDKQEAYAQQLAAGVHYLEAFRKTYNCDNMQDDTINKYANRMKNHPKVKVRTEELKRQVNRALDAQLMGLPAPTTHMPAVMAQAVQAKAGVVAEIVVSRQWVIQEQVKNMQLARETGQTSAAVAAMNSIAKISGFDQDSREKQATGELERMSPDELRAFIMEETSKDHRLASYFKDSGFGELVNMKTIDKLPN